jgi:hypothetical protein
VFQRKKPAKRAGLGETVLDQARDRRTAVRLGLWGLRIAPWVVFGPITGLMSERAIQCHRNGDRLLACLYIMANISVLIALPALTVFLASRL